MQRTLITLGCALALAAGGAFAQQSGANPATSDNANPTMTEKAKQAAQTIGEKAKEAVEKVKDLAQETAQKSKTAGDEKEGAARDTTHSAQVQRMQKQADADFEAAKDKCESIEREAQRTVCEKQAAVVHANAELRIAKAHAAAQGNKTSAMGAGKAAK